MSRRISHLISWGSIAVIAIGLLTALYYLFNLQAFSELAVNNIALRIQWETVGQGQWYALWVLTLLYLSVGFLGLYFLHRAFANIATGELFNLTNSLNLRRFSFCLLAQVVAKPLFTVLSSVLLSLNHPAGEKMLAVSFGSHEISMLALAMILWVLSDLLVVGSKLQSENRQFV